MSGRSWRGRRAESQWAAYLKGAKGRSEELSDEMPSTDSGPEEIAMAADQDAWAHRMVDRLPEDLRRPRCWLSAGGDSLDARGSGTRTFPVLL